MRNLLVFYLVIVITPAWAQPLKFGFVEDKTILEKLPAVKEVQRILDKETAVWEKNFQNQQSLIKVYLDSVTAAVSLLDAARKASPKAAEESPGDQPAAAVAEVDSSIVPADSAASGSIAESSEPAEEAAVDTVILRQNLARLETELERIKRKTVALYREIYGEDGVLERRNAELSQSILERLHRAVSETCGREDTDMVFDSSILLYVDQDLNLTDKVMEELGIGEQRAR